MDIYTLWLHTRCWPILCCIISFSFSSSTAP